MQDRYAGDIGDFGKFGLLKELNRQGLSIGINWYKTNPLDFEMNADGTYKHDDGKHKCIPADLKECDYPLAETLEQIAISKERSIQALEDACLLSDAKYYHERISSNNRVEWHSGALQFFKNNGVDLVFLDPDNGLLVPSVKKGSPRSVKYAYYGEVLDYVKEGFSALVYNHRSRKPELQYFNEIETCIRAKFTDRKLQGSLQILKITFPRYSIRDYIAITADPTHLQKIRAAFDAMLAGKWSEKMCQRPLTMDISFNEYRKRFKSKKVFMQYYRALPENVVRDMISREDCNPAEKASLYACWQQ